MGIVLSDVQERTGAAVAQYWRTLDAQGGKQAAADVDRGGRSRVTGGKQMLGFAGLVERVLLDNGVPVTDILTRRALELPGYFRPTKTWDMLILTSGQLVGALEFKSQAGPSFGNNFNNRSEEAIGTGKDLRVAFREGAFGEAPKPWLGWVMLLEQHPASTRPIEVSEPHFDVFEEFRGASYAKRYELLLRKLVREQLYDGAALLMATRQGGLTGEFDEPAGDLTMRALLAGLVGHALSVRARSA